MKPDYNDVMQAVNALVKECGEVCSLFSPGLSEDGREIPGLRITAPGTPDENKQHVLVIAGQHGSEESGRAIALELLQWLTSADPAAAETRARQVVVVLPCVNPDGSFLDTYHNARDIDIAHTYRFGTPAATSEGRAVENLAAELMPDVFVDIHGLAGGSMKDRVWLSRALPFTPDRYFQTMMAAAMTDAAEEAGFPQCEPVVPPPFEGAPYSLGEKLGVELKALTFGIESIESYYTEEEWRADGLARLKVLFAFGNRDAFGLGCPGYPSSLISGSRICGLYAHGPTAAARRPNRVVLTRFLRNNFAVIERQSDGIDGACRVKVLSETSNGPVPDRFAILLRFKKPCSIQQVAWQKEVLVPSPAHGYRIQEDTHSIMVQVSLQHPFGGPEQWLTVKYDSPYLDRS